MPFVWAIVLMVASYALEALVAKKQQPPQAATYGDFSFPQFEDGTPIPIVFGDVWQPGTVLWYGNLSNVPIYAKGK